MLNCGSDSMQQRPGLAGPVAGLAGRGHGGLMHDDGLVPVAPGMQEAGHGGGDQHGVPVPPGGGGVAGGRLQVGALGVQPGGCLPGRGHRRRVLRRAGRRQRADAGIEVGDALAGGQGGVQVVIQQPPGGGVAICRVVGGGQGAGVLAEQVVQLVPAGGGLGDQVLVIQLIEAAAGLLQAGVVERGGGAGVEVRPGDQAEAAEQPLLGRRQVGVGQAERGGDRQVLGAHQRQPVAGRGQLGGQPAGRPGGTVPQLAGQHPDRQRQVPAQLRDLTHRRIPGAYPGPGRQPGEQGRRLSRGQGIQGDHGRVVQRGQPPAAGDQYQAARGAGQQRPDLLMAGRVIEQQQDLLTRHQVAPACRPGLQSRRDLRRGEPGGQQQAGQRIGGVDRPLPTRVGVQRQEELPVREACGQPVRGMDREGGLADPRHPVDGVNAHHPAVRRHRRQRPGQLIQFGPAAGERSGITRQGPGRRGGEGSRRDAASGREHVLRPGPAPGPPPRTAPRTGPARPSASASRTAVSLWAVRLMPRSRSLTVRGLTPAASASSSWVSRASARSCRSNPAKESEGCSTMTNVPSQPPAAATMH